MKTRHGFVSNSSSASFVVALSVLSEKEIRKIKSYTQYENSDENRYFDHWEIYEDQYRGILTGNTIMDNGSFSEYIGPELSGKFTFTGD